jgi:hypothetical protein
MTETPIAPSTLNCTQCGGELHPDEGQVFVTCPFCSATVYLDKSQVVFHWYLAPTLDQDEARSALARWMAGNHTVKDLDKKAKLTSSGFVYFPLWYFKQKTSSGREVILLEPAAATSVTEIKQMQLPAGDLIKYDSNLDAEAQSPTVPLSAALGWVEEDHRARRQIAESAIVHVPLFNFKYEFNGRIYTALVDGASGKVMANIFPEKAETPYQLVGGIAALVFLCLATFPLIGSAVGEGGFWGGFMVCSGLGIPAALVFMGLAAWVSQKV